MTEPSFPLEVLAAGGDGIVVAAHGGDLFVSGQKQALSRVCGAAVASQDQVYLAALTLEKEVVVFLREKETEFWIEVARHLMPKRPTTAVFALRRKQILVADAFGDVYALPLAGCIDVRQDETQRRTLILGHFSTVTSLALSESLLATADRDAKLRVSRFPESFVIQSFCLAHQEFITCVQWLGDGLLISGAGDGTVRCWDATNGSLLSCIDLHDHVTSHETESGNHDIRVVCVQCLGGKRDSIVVGMYRKNYLLVVDGVLSTSVRVRVAVVTQEGDWITGISVDDRARLWLSVMSNCHSIQAYSVSRIGERSAVLSRERMITIKCVDPICLQGSPEEKQKDMPMWFEWLHQQRKREMTEDWKGKKRKYIDI